MKVKFFLAAALIACVCLGACSNDMESSSTDPTQSNQSSSSENDVSAESESSLSSLQGEESLTTEEVQKIFSDLTDKHNSLIVWSNTDYTQIPIDGIPTHEVEGVLYVNWIVRSDLPYEPVVPSPVYGTITYAKVTDKTLPDFPWDNIQSMDAAISEVYPTPDTADLGLSILTCSFEEFQEGPIFHEFEDGLYFRTNYDHVRFPYEGYDYSTLRIMEQSADQIQFEVYQLGSDSMEERKLVKNNNGEWRFSWY